MAEKIYIGGSGRFFFEIEDAGLLRAFAEANEEKIKARMLQAVIDSTSGLVNIIRAMAPSKSGALRAGIVPSPGIEPRAYEHGNIVKYVWMNPGMNDTFVKTANGKRYYYPASQEYGFRTRSGGRKPGLYYMRNSSASYYQAHEARVAKAVDEILKEIWK